MVEFNMQLKKNYTKSQQIASGTLNVHNIINLHHLSEMNILITFSTFAL